MMRFLGSCAEKSRPLYLLSGSDTVLILFRRGGRGMRSAECLLVEINSAVFASRIRQTVT